jgi:hypothetical protein
MTEQEVTRFRDRDVRHQPISMTFGDAKMTTVGTFRKRSWTPHTSLAEHIEVGLRNILSKNGISVSVNIANQRVERPKPRGS